MKYGIRRLRADGRYLGGRNLAMEPDTAKVGAWAPMKVEGGDARAGAVRTKKHNERRSPGGRGGWATLERPRNTSKTNFIHAGRS